MCASIRYRQPIQFAHSQDEKETGRIGTKEARAASGRQGEEGNLILIGPQYSVQGGVSNISPHTRIADISSPLIYIPTTRTFFLFFSYILLLVVPFCGNPCLVVLFPPVSVVVVVVFLCVLSGGAGRTPSFAGSVGDDILSCRLLCSSCRPMICEVIFLLHNGCYQLLLFLLRI